jgi:uncharacterized Tic20 family protein
MLSGVVRNRKVQNIHEPIQVIDIEGDTLITAPTPKGDSCLSYISGSAFMKNCNLRAHKFKFKWNLAVHLSICVGSLLPFLFIGERDYVVVPIVVWACYNILFVIGSKWANMVVPGFARFKHAVQTSIEEFFSPRLLPVLSISFLLVALSLSVTAKRLGGPPLCYRSCGQCLSTWSESAPLLVGEVYDPTNYRHGCGYRNGKEMLGYYTIAQTSFMLFMCVLIALAVCMAWRVAEEELAERQTAEEWLKREDHNAFQMR